MLQEKVIGVIGLGYVGLPVAVAFAQKFKVVGFDINQKRLEECHQGYDRTGEIPSDVLKKCHINFTSDPQILATANFFIITVPTPIDKHNQPDFTALIKASETVGGILKPGDIVVYESTVYPGATEEVCLPILEKKSSLKVGRDFGLGYSPERINPADKEHTFTKIQKVVSGDRPETLKQIAQTYAQVIEAKVFESSSIKVAEAAKVIENIQRDVNIALMNELAILFDKLEIDTLDVLEAAGTKWNFLPFRPGLVGGHCIGVDPYYLTYKAESVGYHPQVILSGRRINNHMASFIVYRMVQELVSKGQETSQCRVLILGMSFKENCPDIRNSKVIDIIDELKKFRIPFHIHDPFVIQEEAHEEYDGLQLSDLKNIEQVDVIIFAVAHTVFKETYQDLIRTKLKPKGCVIDIKGMIDRNFAQEQNITLWRL